MWDSWKKGNISIEILKQALINIGPTAALMLVKIMGVNARHEPEVAKLLKDKKPVTDFLLAARLDDRLCRIANNLLAPQGHFDQQVFYGDTTQLFPIFYEDMPITSQEEWTRRFMGIEDDRVFTYCIIRASYFIENFSEKSKWDDFINYLDKKENLSDQAINNREKVNRFHCYAGECVKCCEKWPVTMTIIDLYRIWFAFQQQGPKKSLGELFTENVDASDFYINNFGNEFVQLLPQFKQPRPFIDYQKMNCSIYV